MEIILKQDIDGLGYKGDIITVKDGYARNYLIPKEQAIIATESAKKIHEENKRQRAHKEEKIKNEAEEIASKLADVNIKIGAKTSSSGKIFGSVNTIQIAEALRKEGFDIDRKHISIEGDQVKEVGKYKATIKL
ncbi:MAG TPA: 50S ribosomal protein L9, partial [Bacteroidales bacterium]|nr:50S ribosomal protein L9 [Bacteroidales bacterium]